MSVSQFSSVSTEASDRAHDMLREKLNAISGIRITEYTSRPLGQRVINVSVPDGDTTAEAAIYRAELEVYQTYPAAKIELYVV